MKTRFELVANFRVTFRPFLRHVPIRTRCKNNSLRVNVQIYTDTYTPYHTIWHVINALLCSMRVAACKFVDLTLISIIGNYMLEVYIITVV